MSSGGKAASQLVKADHQLSEDPSVRALVNNCWAGEPLVLIADDKYEHFPFDLTKGCDGGAGYGYVVLGYYLVRHCWGQTFPVRERQYDAYTIFQLRSTPKTMKRDTRCASSLRSSIVRSAILGGLSFSVGSISPCACAIVKSRPAETLSYPPGTYGRSITGNKLSIQGTNIQKGSQSVQENTCSCGNRSPHIYEQGWMCLWPPCERHFQLDDGRDATTMTLVYTSSFLAARLNPRKKPTVCIFKPVLEAKNGIVTTPLFYHGWLCQRCGRLSCR